MEGAKDLKRARIYCAGPMGGPGDFTAMRELSSVLVGAGYSTFLPVDDGFPLLEIFQRMDESDWSSAKRAETKYYIMVAVFAFDLFNLLESCHAVVANVNPFEACCVNPDSGTIMELSLAYVFGRPVVAYKDKDVRYFPLGSTLQNGWDNPMIIGMTNNFHLGGGGYVATTYPELLQRLDAALSREHRALDVESMPEHVRRALALGREVDRMMLRHSGQGASLLLRKIEEIAAFIKGGRERFNVAEWNGHDPVQLVREKWAPGDRPGEPGG